MADTPLRADSVRANPIAGRNMAAPATILPFRRPVEPLAYDPGVVPFDRSNPVHIRAWNALYALGWSEQRALERECGE